jgi:hypothetical protein
MPAIHIPVASDDLYWIYPAKRDDLEAFFEYPHRWVADYAQARLADHFAISMRAFDGSQQRGFLIQGIDKTGLVTIRTFPGVPFVFPDLNPKAMTLDLMLSPNPFGPDLPMRAYTHLELEEKPKYIAEYLVTAAGKTDVFLEGYSFDFDNNSARVPTQIRPLPGLALPFNPQEIKVVFRPASDQIEVLYQSHGKLVSPGDPPTTPPPPPPACNSNVGLAHLEGDVLVVNVETIAVKAWP